MQLFTELEFRCSSTRSRCGCRRPTTWSSCRRRRATPVADGRGARRTRARHRRSAIAELARERARARARSRSPSSSIPSAPSARSWSRIAIAVPGKPPAYIPLGHRYIGAPAPPPHADLKPLFTMLEDPTVAKVCHDSKAVIRAFADAAASRSTASSTTRCSRRSCSIRRKTPRPAKRSRSGSAACSLPERAQARRPRRAQALEGVEVERAAPWAGAIADALLADRRAAARAARRRAASTSSTATIELPVARAARRGRADRHPHRRAALQGARRRGRSQARRARGAHLQARRRRIQHRLAQAARRAAVRQARARHQGRAPHQDRLVDRGRDARAAGASDHPADPRSPRAVQAQGHVPRRAAAVDLAAHRPHPHDVQPGRRRDRPDLVAGSEPPEHSDPQRARHEDPQAASSPRREKS